MKRSNILDEITFILDREEDLSHPSKSEVILSKLEELGMYMTKVERLCDEMDLRTITYWDNEDE